MLQLSMICNQFCMQQLHWAHGGMETCTLLWDTYLCVSWNSVSLCDHTLHVFIAVRFDVCNQYVSGSRPSEHQCFRGERSRQHVAVQALRSGGSALGTSIKGHRHAGEHAKCALTADSLGAKRFCLVRHGPVG